MKTINLEEILENAVKNELQHESDKDTILNAMREACNQTIDLCASITPGYVAKMDMQKLKKQIQ